MADGKEIIVETLKVDTGSSVFMSPPSSGESTLPNKVISKLSYWNEHQDKIPFSLDDDDDELVMCSNTETKVDFLEGFLKKSLLYIIAKVLDDLSDKELLRVSHVSKKWKTAVQLHLKSGKRLRRYTKHMRITSIIEKENKIEVIKLSSSTHGTSFHGNVPLTPFNVKVESHNPIPVTPAFVNKGSKHTFRQCPECQSPSRTKFKQIGHCTNCDKDFCLHCFYSENKHSPTCQVVGGAGVSGSPRKLEAKHSRKYSLTSKENKARLKRL